MPELGVLIKDYFLTELAGDKVGGGGSLFWDEGVIDNNWRD